MMALAMILGKERICDKPVYNDGNGKSENENARQCTKPTDDLPWKEESKSMFLIQNSSFHFPRNVSGL